MTEPSALRSTPVRRERNEQPYQFRCLQISACTPVLSPCLYIGGATQPESRSEGNRVNAYSDAGSVADRSKISSAERRLEHQQQVTNMGSAAFAGEAAVAEVFCAAEQQQHAAEGQAHHGDDEGDPAGVGVGAMDANAAEEEAGGEPGEDAGEESPESA